MLFLFSLASWGQVPPQPPSDATPPELTPADEDPPEDTKPSEDIAPTDETSGVSSTEAAALSEELDALRAEVDALREAQTEKKPVEGPSNSLLGRQVEELRTLLENPEPIQVGNLTRMDDARIRITGYADVGFFATQGDGTAYTRDTGNTLFPGENAPWVFYGDPWANPVNSLGDSADLGLDRTNIDRFDPIASGGAPTFLVNAVNQSVFVTFKDKVFLETSINYMPRTGRLGSTGDFLDVDLAYGEWIPFNDVNLHLFAGKFEPTFGLEYRTRKSPDRFNITPSLIGRYLVQSPIGLKVRGGVLNDLMVYNFAVTNGGSSTEQFAHFFNEVDSNAGKTASGRLSVVFPIPAFLEIGGSAMYGAQDGQPDSKVMHQQFAADVRFRAGDLTIEGEWLIQSLANKNSIAGIPELDARGWYLQGRYLVVPGMGIFVRGDRRIARLLAQPNLYLTDTVRFTGGLRFDLTFNVLAKLEYIHVRELNGPDLNDDVFTSSLVLRY